MKSAKMEQGILFTIFCCICAAYANELGPVGIGVEPNGPTYKSVNEDLSLTCTIQEGTSFLLTKSAKWVHKSKMPLQERETLISKQGSVESGLDSSYTVKMDFTSQPGKILVTLNILKIDKGMDGLFICKVSPTNDDSRVLEEAEAEIVVVDGVKELTMTVNDDKFRGVESFPLQLKQGKYPVTCIAKGSNPDSILHLYIGDAMVDHDSIQQTNILDKDSGSGSRSYQSSVKYTLDFTAEKFNKVLKCKAVVNIPSGVSIQVPPKEVTVMLEGVSEKPVIECKNTSAAVGDMYVKLVCTVSMKQHIKLVRFKIGNPEQVLYPGNRTDEYHEVKKEEINETTDQLTLILYKLDEVDFSSNYYLDVVGMDGTTYQYPVYLHKVVTAGTKSVGITLALVCFALIFQQLLI